MTGVRISEVAAKTGIPATTLRYYEDIGLVAASERTDAGYRLYDERTVARIELVARAKQVGLSLDDIRVLVETWDHDECAPVQAAMARILAAKIRDTEARASELLSFARELRVLASHLDESPHEGPCDERCACIGASTQVVIGCTLEGQDERDARLVEWRALSAHAAEREAIPGGMRLLFPPDSTVAAEIGRLTALEVACCGWLDFTVYVGSDRTTLDVRAPAEAFDLVVKLFGSED